MPSLRPVRSSSPPVLLRHLGSAFSDAGRGSAVLHVICQRGDSRCRDYTRHGQAADGLTSESTPTQQAVAFLFERRWSRQGPRFKGEAVRRECVSNRLSEMRGDGARNSEDPERNLRERNAAMLGRLGNATILGLMVDAILNLDHIMHCMLLRI